MKVIKIEDIPEGKKISELLKKKELKKASELLKDKNILE